MKKSYQSPAKINLNLRILKKRSDGFHEVETMMSRLDLADSICFEKSNELSLECSFPGVPCDESNLVIKAIKLLEARVGKSFLYRIVLNKVIPHGAGLAGGSSNAATTLKALNEMEKLDLSQKDLVHLASELGADVAFFLYDSVCVCKGKGEIITPIDHKNDDTVLLLKPKFGVSTPSAYQDWQKSTQIEGVHYAPQHFSWGDMVNDLERPVFAKHRFLAEIKMWLLKQPEVTAAMMSGSGSTMFALIRENAEEVRNRALEELDPQLWNYIGALV